MPKEVYRSPPFNMHGYVAFRVRLSDGRFKTVIEHREIMAEHLGRRLLPSEHVHHRNGNPRDNRVANLEVMPAGAHARHHASRGVEKIVIVCLWCEEPAELLAREVRNSQLRQGKAGPFCGKQCAGRWIRQQQIQQGKINLRAIGKARK